jgi:hypothetical protein
MERLRVSLGSGFFGIVGLLSRTERLRVETVEAMKEALMGAAGLTTGLVSAFMGVLLASRSVWALLERVSLGVEGGFRAG